MDKDGPAFGLLDLLVVFILIMLVFMGAIYLVEHLVIIVAWR